MDTGGDGSSAKFGPPGDSEHEALARICAVLEQPERLNVVYQPIVDIFDGRVAGVEALTRIALDPPWPPDVWFRQAGRVGLGIELELLALHRAIECFDDLHDRYLSLNLSAEAFVSPPFAEFVRMLGSRAERLVIELTEHAEVVAYERVQAALASVRFAGVRLAVDDAGAGYSSFRHILRLAPDFVKLDRSIVADLDTDPARRALATALAEFANEIGAGVVAEGVERLEELHALRTTGVRLVQGYLTGRPSALPVEVPSLPFSGAGRRALLVDDDAAVRLLVSRVLRRSGFDVLGEAADGREGIALAQTLKPDVVVLDLNMPGLDGLHALPQLRKALPGARIIVLSGDTHRPGVPELSGLGADAVVGKQHVTSRLPELLSEL